MIDAQEIIGNALFNYVNNVRTLWGIERSLDKATAIIVALDAAGLKIVPKVRADHAKEEGQ